MTFRTAARRALTGVAALALTISTLGVVAPAANAAASCPIDNATAQQSAGPGVDWSGCNLAGYQLGMLNLTGANLAGANMYQTDLSGTVLSNAIMTGDDMRKATFAWGAALDGADLSGATLVNVNVAGANMYGTNLSGAFLGSMSLAYANLGMANLTTANLTSADLSNVDLSLADMTGATLSSANFSGANFNKTNLSNAHAWGFVPVTNFSSAYMVNTNLSSTALPNATFNGAVISDSTWSGGDLSGTDFSGANLTNVTFASATNLDYSNFSNTQLNNVTFLGAHISSATFAQTLFINGSATGTALDSTNFLGATGLTAAWDLGGNNWTLAICPDGSASADHVNGSCVQALLPPADTTPPTVTGAITSAPINATGWYTNPVTVHWTCTDDVAVATCPADTTMTVDGKDQTITSGPATDTSGNTATGTVNGVWQDATPPTIVGTVTPNGATSQIDWTCTDATSGVNACPLSETVTTPGTSTVTRTGTDAAGNTGTGSVTVTNTPVVVVTPTPTPTPTATPTPTPTPTVPPVVVLTKPVVTDVTPGHTYPYGTVLTPKCSATSSTPTAVVTCTGVTKTSLNGRVHTFTATAKTTVAGATTTSTSVITWYTAAKPVVAVSPIHFPAGLRHTTTGMPVVYGGGRYTLTITVPRGAKAPLWIYSVRTNSRGTTGTPTVRQLNVTFHRVNATTWRVLFTPNRVTFAQYRKFGIKIGTRLYTATAYLR